MISWRGKKSEQKILFFRDENWFWKKNPNFFWSFLDKTIGKILGKVNEIFNFSLTFPKIFFRKFCDPKIFQRYFSSDSKNCFLRWNLFKFVLKCAHWSPLSNEPKTIEIVRVVQKLSTKRCREPLYHKDVSFPLIWGPHLVPWLTESGKQEATASPEQEASLFTFFVKYSRPRPASCFVEVESWDRPFRLSRALPGSGKVEIKENLKSDISII